MSEQLLQVRNLSVSVEDKPILHGIDLEVRPGETHVLMGPNGAGKSTLGYTIMGSPRYEVTDGEILFKGKELLEETADQRAKDGIFLSFQNPWRYPEYRFGISFVMPWNREVVPVSSCGPSKRSWSRQWKYCRWILPTGTVI